MLFKFSVDLKCNLSFELKTHNKYKLQDRIKVIKLNTLK